jgi:hypothetical protein
VGVNVSPSSVNSSGSKRFGSINCAFGGLPGAHRFRHSMPIPVGRGYPAKVKKASVEKPGYR